MISVKKTGRNITGFCAKGEQAYLIGLFLNKNCNTDYTGKISINIPKDWVILQHLEDMGFVLQPEAKGWLEDQIIQNEKISRIIRGEKKIGGYHPALHYSEFREYQERGSDFLLFVKKAILADQEGLGKKLQALDAMSRAGKDSNILIIPSYLKHYWIEEIKDWFSEVKIFVCEGKEAKKESVVEEFLDYTKMHKGIIIICLEHLFWQGFKKLKNQKSTIIVDQVHRYDKIQLKAISDFSSENIYLLTSKPLKVENAFYLLNLCDSRRFTSEKFLLQFFSNSNERLPEQNNKILWNQLTYSNYFRRDYVMVDSQVRFPIVKRIYFPFHFKEMEVEYNNIEKRLLFVKDKETQKEIIEELITFCLYPRSLGYRDWNPYYLILRELNKDCEHAELHTDNMKFLDFITENEFENIKLSSMTDKMRDIIILVGETWRPYDRLNFKAKVIVKPIIKGSIIQYIDDLYQMRTNILSEKKAVECLLEKIQRKWEQQ